jgi:hypothetical protein
MKKAYRWSASQIAAANRPATRRWRRHHHDPGELTALRRRFSMIRES